MISNCLQAGHISVQNCVYFCARDLASLRYTSLSVGRLVRPSVNTPSNLRGIAISLLWSGSGRPISCKRQTALLVAQSSSDITAHESLFKLIDISAGILLNADCLIVSSFALILSSLFTSFCFHG